MYLLLTYFNKILFIWLDILFRITVNNAETTIHIGKQNFNNLARQTDFKIVIIQSKLKFFMKI